MAVARPAGDIIIGVGLAVGAALVAFAIIPVWVEPVPHAIGWYQSPRLLPWLSTAVTGLLGIVIACRGWLRDERDAMPVASGAKPAAALRAVAMITLAIVVICLLANATGMAASGAIVCVGLMLFGGERRPMVLIVAGVAVPISLIELLRIVGSVPMPVGPFGF